MRYESIDVLQNSLARDVFHYTRDSKKAAGRALGTLVEIINFYTLKAWGYEKRTAIERRIPEYANPDLTHNVEFTLHPTDNISNIELAESDLPFTARKIQRELGRDSWDTKSLKSNQLLSSAKLLRNACTIYESDDEIVVAYLGNRVNDKWEISVEKLHLQPFAMFECKRVGVEEGMKKGPQTIEKAKQGAYVARTVSSLQRIRKADGSSYGVLPLPDSSVQIRPYEEFIQAILRSNELDLLKYFVLTVGIVSNHGNWFTSDDHNKELKVLAQSYDWLLFLTDTGLAQFIYDLLLEPDKDYQDVREAFVNSYSGVRGRNRFTKVNMSLSADRAIQIYFERRLSDIEEWFNVIPFQFDCAMSLSIRLRTVIPHESGNPSSLAPQNMVTSQWIGIISPNGKSVAELKSELDTLANKNWQDILK